MPPTLRKRGPVPPQVARNVPPRAGHRATRPPIFIGACHHRATQSFGLCSAVPLRRCITAERWHGPTRNRPPMTREFARKATERNCPRCASRVLRGLDGDSAARLATADLEPVNQLEETVAHLQGRDTYSLSSGELTIRSKFSIAASERRHSVLVEHRCLPADIQELF